MFEMLPDFVLQSLNFLATLLVFAIGCIIVGIAILYVIDRTQTKNTVRRNYPVIGRLRTFFEHIGEFSPPVFLRHGPGRAPVQPRPAQLGLSRFEERGQHDGLRLNPRPSTRRHADVRCLPLPDAGKRCRRAISRNHRTPIAERPYTQKRIFNISGMSYGALSRVAVKSLSRGAGHAGCWYNTGEGAMSEFHLEGGCDIVFQVGTAKYGCRKQDGAFCDEAIAKVAAHPEVKMFEVKLRPRRQARQGRHSARRQGDVRDFRDPRHPDWSGQHQPQPPCRDRQSRRGFSISSTGSGAQPANPPASRP